MQQNHNTLSELHIKTVFNSKQHKYLLEKYKIMVFNYLVQDVRFRILLYYFHNKKYAVK